MDANTDGEELLAAVLRRSVELDDRMMLALDAAEYVIGGGNLRVEVSLKAATVALEHGRALLTLVGDGFHTSAAGLSRLQHEALIRSVWAFYAASDADVEKLAAPLSAASAVAAKHVPTTAGMLQALEGKAAAATVLEALRAFQKNNAPAINSFVHSGIHALQRVALFPPPLVIGIVRNSNGLSLMTAMMLAVLAGRQEAMHRLGRLQRKFAAVLPALVEDVQPPA